MPCFPYFALPEAPPVCQKINNSVVRQMVEWNVYVRKRYPCQSYILWTRFEYPVDAVSTINTKVSCNLSVVHIIPRV